jgi:cytochrome c oxidase subunit 2
MIHVDKYERYYIIAIAIVLGIFFASVVAAALIFGMRPAGVAGFIIPAEIDQSEFANPGLREVAPGRYQAHVVAQMWSFAAGSSERDEGGREILRVPVGSEVTFYMTSRDVSHGFILEDHNLNFQVLPGHIASGRVVLNRPGTYRMICHEYCGRAHQNMWFTLIVEEAAPAA